METSKHLKNMESFVKIEPNNLKERVATLEESNQSLKETIQLLMKRIDALENTPPVDPPVAPPVAPPIPETDIDDIINIVYGTFTIDLEPYKQATYEYGEEKSTINYNKFIDNFFDNEDKKLLYEDKNPNPLLSHSYSDGIEQAIAKKMCKLIPKDTIKVKDEARNKYSICSNGVWLNPIKSEEKLQEIIKIFNDYIIELNNVYLFAKQRYGTEIQPDKWIDLSDKLQTDDESNKRIVKIILSYFGN